MTPSSPLTMGLEHRTVKLREHRTIKLKIQVTVEEHRTIKAKVQVRAARLTGRSLEKSSEKNAT